MRKVVSIATALGLLAFAVPMQASAQTATSPPAAAKMEPVKKAEVAGPVKKVKHARPHHRKHFAKHHRLHKKVAYKAHRKAMHKKHRKHVGHKA